ncbi:MAG TPA: radical SAM protein [Chitinophagaceae bacterium]|nr:MAG: radical SAM protein [Bacteroidetes bacterium OLB11]HMN32169.1 radical SAM protein [Chitinophagaceae bacterium]
MQLKQSPYILYSDGKGNIFEDDSLYALGRTGWDAVEVELDSWVELPEGGNLYELPGRRGIGKDVLTGELRLCEKGWAVAAFIPPAFTGLYIAPYETLHDAPTLPLFCYTAAAWSDGQFYVTAVRIEKDIRQDKSGYNQEKIQNGVENLMKAYPKNRLVKHLANTCCNTYQCPAARNFFLGRWECPIPSSPACNANCLGCISFQPEDEKIVSSHDRLTFKPSVEEIVEYTVPHLETAPFPIISWGQGCEGEPLLMWETIEKSIIEIRKHTSKGSINVNTNGSNPKAVKRLMEAGLNSIRVSLNSFRDQYYTPYYRPNNYELKDLLESLKIVTDMGGWASINYFVFPGTTDSEEEIEALFKAIEYTKLNMIQWRNFNIDPDWYLTKLNISDTGTCFGVKQAFNIIQEEFPKLKYGYFNPPIERIKGDYDESFAH